MADYSVTAASVALVSGNKSSGTAGAAITAGQALYKDTSDSDKLKLADADSSSATATLAGVALNDAASGQPVTYALPGAVVNMGTTFAVADVVILSGTAGGIAPVADLASSDWLSIVGHATTTANLKLDVINSGVQKV